MPEKEDLTCCMCHKKITEVECSKDYKCPICKQCAREMYHYGTD
jgi:hypothetical protein